jgi:hypothetical protein
VRTEGIPRFGEGVVKTRLERERQGGWWEIDITINEKARWRLLEFVISLK